MSRRIRRDTHKRVSSSGYQQMQGDLEVQGNLLGPAITNLNAAIAKISATSTTPVKLTAPQLEGIMRGIEVRWQRQYNLANFSHYELQVSDDDESWYSLLLDGSGWKGNLNEDTDVKTEVFTHANIPLLEDAGDLVGISLYYRVRQVTFSEVRGEWSDSAYSTTRGVQDVVLTDSRNRYIEISSKKGIYADDRQGHVIHDIPDAPVLTDMIYGGHVIWREAPAVLQTVNASYGSADTTHAWSGAVINTPVDGYLAGLTNVKGLILGVYLTGSNNAAKTEVGMRWGMGAFYCHIYDTAGAANQPLVYVLNKAEVAGLSIEIGIRVQASAVPLTWNAGIPYISWWQYIYWNGSTNNNSAFSITTALSILGYHV
jgi:hypothetical protein